MISRSVIGRKAGETRGASAARRVVAGVASRMRRSPAIALVRDRRGATAIEFAMVAPLVIFGVMEICQAGLYVIYQTNIEAAAAKASRKIMVGGLDSGASTADGFRTNTLCPMLAIGSCDNVVTDIQRARLDDGSGGYRPFINDGLSGLMAVEMNNAKSSYCIGAPGSYLYVQAFYAVPVFSPIWKASAKTVAFNGRKVVFVRGASAFRNEPYTTASATSGC